MLQLGGWAAFAAAMTFSRIGIYPLSYMLLDKGILTALGIVLTLGLRALYRRLRHSEPSLPVLLIESAAASYLLSIPWTAAHRLAVAAYVAWQAGDPLEIESWFQLMGGTVYHAFVLMAWSVLYFGINYYDDLQRQRERAVRAEAHAQWARLEALRYQIHPHFLFNTLNAISTLVAEGETRSAGRMIARLSDFLRLTLDDDVAEEVPLAQEIDFVKQYLDIEQIRFGERLQTRIDVEPETLSALVPSLVLQPLVENAVRHGISSREDGGEVVVSAGAFGDRLRLRVSDRGIGAVSPATHEAGGKGAAATFPHIGSSDGCSGIGLANTRSRLRELYGENQHLVMRRSDGGRVEVTIELPLSKTPVGIEA